MYVESRFLRVSGTEQSSLFASYLITEEVHPKSMLSDVGAMHELQKTRRTISFMREWTLNLLYSDKHRNSICDIVHFQITYYRPSSISRINFGN